MNMKSTPALQRLLRVPHLGVDTLSSNKLRTRQVSSRKSSKWPINFQQPWAQSCPWLWCEMDTYIGPETFSLQVELKHSYSGASENRVLSFSVEQLFPEGIQLSGRGRKLLADVKPAAASHTHLVAPHVPARCDRVPVPHSVTAKDGTKMWGDAIP